MMKLNIQLFASSNASGTITFPQGGSSYKTIQGKIVYSESNASIDNNTSKIHTKIYAKVGTGGTTGKGWNGYVIVNGNKHSFSSLSSSTTIAGSYVLLKEYDDTIEHNSDGSKTITISGSVSGPSGTSIAGVTSSGSGSVELYTIPRASTFNSITQAFTSTDEFIPTIIKKSSSFYDRLIVSYGGNTIKTIDNVISGTKYKFTNSELNTLYALYGNNSALTLTFTLKTYSNNSYDAQIGGSTSLTSVCNLPSYSLSLSASIEDSVTNYNTYKPDSKTFIANLSKPKLTFNASSSTGSTYGNSINYKVNNITRTSPYIENNYTGGNYTITATDGRKTTLSTLDMKIVNYSKPSISSLKIVRTAPTASTADVTIVIKYHDGTGLTNLLSRALSFKYQEKDGTQITKSISDFNLSESTSENIKTLTATLRLTNLNYKKSLTANVVFTDLIGLQDSKPFSLSSGLPVWNAYSDSNNNNVFNVNGRTIVKDGIHSLPTGQVNTQVGNSSLIIKRASATADSTPNNGVVLEFGNSINWVGQLFIGDNATQGIYYNGWSDGVRGSWKRLVDEASLLNKIYPIGSIYISTKNNSPQNFLGGKWEAFGTGRTLVGINTSDTDFNTSEKTGGSKEMQKHSHTLSGDGAHTHTTKSMSSTGSTTGAMAESYAKYGGTRNITIPFSGSNGGHTHTIGESGTGTSGNLQPYIVVYMWKRTE